MRTVRKGGEVPLADKAYDAILRLIVDGLILEGNRLPTEAEFCKSLAVSRPVVREALSRLKTDGLIASRAGHGSVVLRRPREAIFAGGDTGTVAGAQKMFEFREVLDKETAALAAERHTSEDLARIERANAALATALRQGLQAIELDLDFHEAIIKAGHNRIFTDVFAEWRAHFVPAMKIARELMRNNYQSRAEIVLDEHRAVIDAIRARDPEAARRQMAQHLRNTRRRFFHEDDVSGPKAAAGAD